MEETIQESKASDKKIVMGFALIAVLVVGGYLLTRNQNSQQAKKETMSVSPTTVVPTKEMQTESTTGAKMSTNEAAMTKGQPINVEASNFSFSVKEIKVKKGDIVNIAFTTKAGNHDFVIDEFGVKTKVLKTGESENVSFVANKAGTFDFYCSVGNHRAMGMVGKLIVE